MNRKIHSAHTEAAATTRRSGVIHTTCLRHMAAFLFILVILAATAPLHASDRTIDMLIVYTPAVTANHGSHDGVAAHVHAMIESTNISYANSGIDGELRLAGLEEVDYVEDPDSQGTDLSRLRHTSDGHLDEVHQIRNEVGADLVCLLRKGAAGGAAGIAYLLSTTSGSPASGFSVVGTEHALSFTFAHEIGHNLGAHHARGDSFNGQPSWGGIFSYSNGHRFYGSSGSQYRTIMAYSPGTRIAHFSNPGIQYNHTATGVAQSDPESADNAATLNMTIPVVAGYRESRPNPDIIEHPSSQLVTAPDTATFSVSSSGTEPMTYQWQLSADHGSSWTAISGATAASHTTGATATTMSGYQYRCVVSNAVGSLTTHSAILTVDPAAPSALAVWDFSGEPGNQAQTSGLTDHPGLIVHPLTRGPSLAAVAASNCINSSGWSISEERDSDAYYEFGVHFVAGIIGTIDSISFAERRSSTGPTRFMLTSSLDNHQEPIGESYVIPSDTSTRSRQIPLGSGFSPLAGDVRFRLYAFQAVAGTGTWRLANPSDMSGLTMMGSVEELQPEDYESWSTRLEIPSYRRGIFESAAGDGLPNIVRYFQGIEPMEGAGAAGLLNIERTGHNQLHAWFRRSLVTDGSVSGSVRWSRDLNTWHPGGASVDGTTVTLDMNQLQPDPASLKREWVQILANIDGHVPESMFLRLQVDNHIPGQTVVLDPYDNSDHFDNGRYAFHPHYNRPLNQISVHNGILRIYPGSVSTAVHLWSGGQKLNLPGDWVSIDIVSRVYGAAGLYLTGSLESPQGGREIRLYENSETIAFKGPWGDAVPDSAPTGPVKLKIELLEVSGPDISMRATLSGNGFTTIIRDFEITADAVYFGPAAYAAYASNSYYQSFDNLTIHKNHTGP